MDVIHVAPTVLLAPVAHTSSTARDGSIVETADGRFASEMR